MEIVNEIIEVRPYSTKELSEMFSVCPRTFRKWLEPFKNDIGVKRGRYYSVIQVNVIIERLGVPYKMAG
jgi:hypothetical protein